jgi:hypothetical protein
LWDHLHSSRTGSGFADTTGVVHLGDGVMLKANLASEVPTAWFEYSVPNYLEGHNLAPSSVTDVMGSASDFWTTADHFVDWATPVQELQIMRLDAALDFTSPSPSATTSLLDGLRSLDSPYHPPTTSYEHDKGLTSVRVGRGTRWKAILYAKDQELFAHAARTRDATEKARLLHLGGQATGQVRCEVLMRKPVLRERGITTLADLNTQNVIGLHRCYFDRAGFGAAVGSNRWTAIYRDADEQTKKLLTPVITMLTLQAHGLRMQASPNSLAKYKQVAKQHSLTAADFMPGAPTNAVRLDYTNALLITDYKAA